MGRYLHNNAINACQAALHSDLSAMRDASLDYTTPRSHPTSLVHTKEVTVCRCWAILGEDGHFDFAAIKKLAEEDPLLEVRADLGGEQLTITLPLDGRAAANGQRRHTAGGAPLLGKMESLRRGLCCRQRVIAACHCGRLNCGRRSRIVDFVLQKRACGSSNAGQEGGGQRGLGWGVVDEGEESGRESTDGGGGGVAQGREDAQGIRLSGRDISSAGSSVDGLSGGRHCARLEKVSRRVATAGEMPSHLSPHWVLGLLLPRDAVSGVQHASSGNAQAPPSLDERNEAMRKQETALRMLLMRSKTYSFVSWSVRMGVAREDLVEAARSLLHRLQSARLKMRLASTR